MSEVQKEEEKLEVNSIYFQHGDDTSSKRIKLFLLILENKEHFIFIKERINGSDMYYIPLYRGYLKIWQDRKKNILFYISQEPLRLFANEIMFWDTYSVCDKEIEIKGPLAKFLEHNNDDELEKIVKYLVCNKF